MRNFEWTTVSRTSSRCPPLVPLACYFLICFAAGANGADDKKPAPADQHTAVGKVLTSSGSLVWREGASQPWHVAKQGDPVRTGDLLLAMPFAFLEVNGGVRLDLLGDIERRTPFPILESALVLRDAAGADVDFTLDRGRVFVTN